MNKKASPSTYKLPAGQLVKTPKVQSCPVGRGRANNKPDSHRVLFIFDEPTTGLHFHDIKKLLASFNALIEQGHSILVIEHNMDVIRSAEWVIDLGPEAGDGGGNLVFAGKPVELRRRKDSHTAKYL